MAIVNEKSIFLCFLLIYLINFHIILWNSRWLRLLCHRRYFFTLQSSGLTFKGILTSFGCNQRMSSNNLCTRFEALGSLHLMLKLWRLWRILKKGTLIGRHNDCAFHPGWRKSQVWLTLSVSKRFGKFYSGFHPLSLWRYRKLPKVFHPVVAGLLSFLKPLWRGANVELDQSWLNRMFNFAKCSKHHIFQFVFYLLDSPVPFSTIAGLPRASYHWYLNPYWNWIQGLCWKVTVQFPWQCPSIYFSL